MNFRVGGGYRLRIPIGGWMTWNDRLLEGTGAAPDLEVATAAEALRAGRDPALQSAIKLLS